MTTSKESPEEADPQEPLQPYSAFTTPEKWTIVALSAYAAWFSTVSSFIYYPAIPALSQSLSEPVDRINLTITSYLAVAAIAPTLVGDAADILGRRPVYLVTLGVYLIANVAIALTRTYAALVGLRVLQALAISGWFPSSLTPAKMLMVAKARFLSPMAL